MGPSAPGAGPQLVVPGAGWVDLISRVIVTVGFPVVVAGILLWYVLGDFQKGLGGIVTRMGNNTEAVARLIEAEDNILKELRGQTEEINAQTQFLKQIAAQSNRVVEIQEERQRMLKGKSP